jgi:putative ABC transport system permease protein
VLAEGGREYPQDISRLEDVFARAPSSEWMSTTIAAAVGVLGLLLSVVGIHGVLAYSVSRRTREIGLRVAVGAAPGRIMRMVMREGVALAVVGVAIGVPAAVLAARSLRTLMFGVSDADPMTLIAASVVFVLVGLAAGIIPARRATRVDPAVALRAE